MNSSVLESRTTTKKAQSDVKKEKETIFTKIAQLLPSNRTAEQVAKCYNNMRARAIEKERFNKAELKKTGGGIPESKSSEPWEEELLSFVKKAEPIEQAPKAQCSDSSQIQIPSKRPKLLLSPKPDEAQHLSALKCCVLATQGLAEAHRLPESELKTRLIKRYEDEIASTLFSFEDNESF